MLDWSSKEKEEEEEEEERSGTEGRDEVKVGL